MEPFPFARDALRRLGCVDLDLEQDFIRLHRRLAVGEKEVRDRDGAFSARRSEDDVRIKRQQNRRGVADRGSGDKISSDRGAVADLARSENPEHLGPHGEIIRNSLTQLGQRDRSPDLPHLALFLQAAELRN